MGFQGRRRWPRPRSVVAINRRPVASVVWTTYSAVVHHVCLPKLCPPIVCDRTLEFPPRSHPRSQIGSGAHTGAVSSNVLRITQPMDERPFSMIPIPPLDLAVPQGQFLAPGLYTGATRYPFEGSSAPGLSLYGDGRGDNQSTGYFNILEISYAGNQLLSLAADFVQYDELNPNAISRGSIGFSSDIPLNTGPEPSTLFLFLGGLAIVLIGKTTIRARS